MTWESLEFKNRIKIQLTLTDSATLTAADLKVVRLFMEHTMETLRGRKASQATSKQAAKKGKDQGMDKFNDEERQRRSERMKQLWAEGKMRKAAKREHPDA